MQPFILTDLLSLQDRDEKSILIPNKSRFFRFYFSERKNSYSYFKNGSL